MKSATPIQASDEAILPCPPENVWRVLADIAAYPNWWSKQLRLRVLTVRPELLGSEVEVRPLGGRPFRCRVTEVEVNRRMRLEYFGGFIIGGASGCSIPSAQAHASATKWMCEPRVGWWCG